MPSAFLLGAGRLYRRLRPRIASIALALVGRLGVDLANKARAEVVDTNPQTRPPRRFAPIETGTEAGLARRVRAIQLPPGVTVEAVDRDPFAGSDRITIACDWYDPVPIGKAPPLLPIVEPLAPQDTPPARPEPVKSPGPENWPAVPPYDASEVLAAADAAAFGRAPLYGPGGLLNRHPGRPGGPRSA